MDQYNLQQTRELYRFSAFQLDAAERRLWRGGELVSLKPKQFELLFCFIENAGRVMTKSELLDAVWADAYVEETTLARNVSWLRKLLEDDGRGERIIETVPKLGYRFTAQVSRFDKTAEPEIEPNTVIVEEQTIRYFRSAETISIADEVMIDQRAEPSREKPVVAVSLPPNALPRRSFALTAFLIGSVFAVFAGSGYLFYGNSFIADAQTGGSQSKKPTIEKAEADTIQPIGAVSEKAQVKIGSIINLRNRSSETANYLDVWRFVRSKPEFAIVPTEIMFVATHPNPNRDNNSGSWEIVSATGKKDGEPLIYGDKIHLKNMHSDAGYLDNCGWLKDMPVYKKFAGTEKFAVFTAYSEDRDDGTGTWIVGSDDRFDGDSVLEGEGITLETGFEGGGFLNAAGSVSDIPAFGDYDGSQLVFIHKSSNSRRPDSGIWIIANSQTAPK